MKLQVPWARTIRLRMILASGYEIVQDVLDYKIEHGPGDTIRAVNYTWPGGLRQIRYRLVRGDHISAVGTEQGPRYWRGWIAR